MNKDDDSVSYDPNDVNLSDIVESSLQTTNYHIMTS
jgi:hypothetical protein